MTDADNDCYLCNGELEAGELNGNWREYRCGSCGSRVLRSVASDHGKGFSMEDLESMASYDDADPQS